MRFFEEVNRRDDVFKYLSFKLVAKAMRAAKLLYKSYSHVKLQCSKTYGTTYARNSLYEKSQFNSLVWGSSELANYY